jgi:hypothetical protein
MVRGHAKAVSQAKNQAKLADKAASAKRDGSEVSALRGVVRPPSHSLTKKIVCLSRVGKLRRLA